MRKVGGIMGEVWKNIEDYPEYEVSNQGRVRSKDRVFYDSLGRKYNKKGQLIKIEKQIGKKDGYTQLMVGVWSRKKMHRLIVARLVAKAFIPNPHNLPQVNHIDENSENNRVENLEWCSANYNMNYGNSLKRRAQSRSRAIKVCDIFGNLIKVCNSAVEASIEFDVSRASISQCCNGAKKSAKGYTFNFN